MSNLVPLTIDLLLAAVILLVFVTDLILPADEKRGLGALAAVGVAVVLGATFLVQPGGEAFGGAFVLDAVGLYLKRIFLAAGLLGLLLSIDHSDKRYPTRQGEYYLLMLFSLLGMCLLSGARELILLAVSFELMGIPLYVLAAMAKNPDGKNTEAALKLFLVGATSTVIGLWGLSFIYGATGTTQIAAIAAAESTPLLRLGMVATMAGWAFKLGIVPFHMWVPDTYEGAPTPFVGFLSVAPKAAGFAAFIRLFMGGLLGFHGSWGTLLLVLAGVTMILGNLIAVPQNNVKRLLAGSGIGHMGIMMLSFAIGTAEGLAMLLFYLAAYVFTNMGAFAVQTVLGDRYGSDDIDMYRGLAQRAPGLALAMLIFLLSLGGIPFVAGFWAKLYVFVAAWQQGQWLLVILGASMAVLGLFYYLRVARAMYIEPPAEGAQQGEPMALPARLALLAAVIGVVGMGVYPRPFVDSALEAARGLLGLL